MSRRPRRAVSQQNEVATKGEPKSFLLGPNRARDADAWGQIAHIPQTRPCLEQGFSLACHRMIVLELKSPM